MRNLSEFRKRNGNIIDRNELNVFIFGGFDIDDQDRLGNSYLHLLVMSGDSEGVKLFCDTGVNVELKNKAGKQAIDISLDKFKEFPSENNKKIIDIISGHMIKYQKDKSSFKGRCVSG